MAATDHIVSVTVSAAIHLLGMLLIGFLITHHRVPETAVEPAALEVASLELSLSMEEVGLPGARAAQGSAARDYAMQ